MNKAAIKNFAIEARKKLIASVKDKAGRIGITKDSITDPISKGEGYAIFPTHIGVEAKLTGKEVKQRDNLVKRIKSKENGYELVMEEVAYTWFNRLIAIRFMEVNDYLPSRVRVLSSETAGKFEPDIVTQAPEVDLEFSPTEIEEVLTLKEKNAMDQLFRMLFIKQCNELGKILPELFENTSKENNDYTEILLDISYTNEDGVLRDLLKIDEADFLEAVEIIGWMYQYYNTEPKDETFALLKKNVKITKERIPAATQLFTPDWIVRYMVENSLGRLWMEGHPDSDIKGNWKYYLDEAEQEEDVKAELAKLREERKNLRPEDIKVIDPCMGSGHILVYAFDVLVDIYKACGYTERDAAKLILEHNLYGLDIDDRAYQLAYFAVMMKARAYSRKIFSEGIQLNICAIKESDSISKELLSFAANQDKEMAIGLKCIVEEFRNAKEYGSLLNAKCTLATIRTLLARLNMIKQAEYTNLLDLIQKEEAITHLYPLLKQAEIMAQKYDVVVTNPPYMGNKGMSNCLSDYVTRYFPNCKSDLFAVFLEKCAAMTKEKNFFALVTSYTWMFLSSYSKMREYLISNYTIYSLVQPEYHAFFEEAYVPLCSFMLRKCKLNYAGEYISLQDFYGADLQPIKMTQAVENPSCGYRYTAHQDNFAKIPGTPITYWASNKVAKVFENKKLIEFAEPKRGLCTCANEIFYRNWFEISFDEFSLNKQYRKLKWVPLNKGGEYRKWYGNLTEVVLWEDNGQKLRSYSKAQVKNERFYFLPAITWSSITSGKFSVMPCTPFDGQYKQMVNCTLREVLRKCQNTVQNLKWKQLNV